MSYSPREPRLTRLVDLIEARLSPQEVVLVEQQLAAGGVRADHALRWTKQFLAVASAVPLYDAPEEVRERLRLSFAASRLASAALEETSVEVTLALLFDSSRDLELAGTRSGDQDDDVVHLAYSSEEADLVLDISGTAAGTLRIEGQVLPVTSQSAGEFQSQLSFDGLEPRAAACDSHGRFSFEGVVPGQQRLRAGNGNLVLVADLNLRDPRGNSAADMTPRSTQASRGVS